MRFVPLILVIAFVVLGVGWRAWLHQHRYGSSGIVLFRSGSLTQHLREAALIGLFALLLGEAWVAAVRPFALSAWSFMPPRPWIGTALVCAGTALMLVAQLDMGASWRMGVDESTRPGLVAKGLYRRSRNPIYVGMLGSLLGFVLLLPTWPSLGTFVAALLGIHRQVLEEEAFLTRTYGEAYRAYLSQVSRFLPW